MTLSNELRNINHTFEDRKEKLRRLSLAGKIWVNLFSQEEQQQAVDSWNWLKKYCQINLYPATHLIADILEGEQGHPFFTQNIDTLEILAFYITLNLDKEVMEWYISTETLEIAENKATKITLNHLLKLE